MNLLEEHPEVLEEIKGRDNGLLHKMRCFQDIWNYRDLKWYQMPEAWYDYLC